MNERQTLKINEKGHLEIGGCDSVELAARFGTPLYVFDEPYIRDMMSVYRDTIAKSYGGNGLVLYASKAFSCLAVYRIAAQEGIGVDVVSGGELYTALKAGFPADKIYMHGNNKLPRELEFAVNSGVGNIVLDAYDEADMLEELCAAAGRKQDVLIRINPGVEAHTHAFVQTARTDSKFGFSFADGAEPPGCRCAQVIRGVTAPADCALFGKVCTPQDPVGPCMVSSEGACAAAYRYQQIPL